MIITHLNRHWISLVTAGHHRLSLGSERGLLRGGREDPTVDELALLWQHEEEDELQVHALKTAKVRHPPPPATPHIHL